MEVILAKTAGFCFGVKRAVEQVYEQIDSGKEIYTYGPIIHNEEVVKDLETRGVHVIESPEGLTAVRGAATVVIRSHGISKNTMDQLAAHPVTIVDATCPFVKRIHNTVQKESSEGCQIVIIGDAGHPEVEGIRGWSVTPAVVLGTAEEARKFVPDTGKKLCIVSQTTFNFNKFKELVEILEQKGYDINIVNTICNATEERQTEAARIAGEVDAMIVIGGKNSSNSKKLYEICRMKCKNTVFIQTLRDLHLDLMGNTRRIGITAGASTPNNIIEEVQNYVRINF